MELDSDLPHTTELIIASSQGNTPSVHRILETSPHLLEEYDRVGWTPLFHAVYNLYIDVVQVLLTFGANARHQAYYDGSTIFHVLAVIPRFEEENLEEYISLWKLFLSQGISPGVPNYMGERALHLLCQFGDFGTIKGLLGGKHIRDINCLTHYTRETAFDYMLKYKYWNIPRENPQKVKDLQKLLESYGAKSYKDNPEKLAMIWSSSNSALSPGTPGTSKETLDATLDATLGATSETTSVGMIGKESFDDVCPIWYSVQRERLRTPIFKLPLHLLIKIFHLIQRAEDLCQLNMTCRLFQKITKKDILWEPLSNPLWANYPSPVENNSNHNGQSDNNGNNLSLSWREKYSLWLKEYIHSYRHLHSKFRIQKQSKLYHFYLKILLIGAQGVGKTSFLRYFLYSRYFPKPDPTYNSDFQVKLLHYNNRSLQAHVWEIANSNLFNMFNLAAGALALFDMTSSSSFSEVKSLIGEIRTKIPSTPPIPIILVATKCDLPREQREVKAEQITQLCTEFGLECIETSAKTGYQIDAVFLKLITKISEYNIKTPRPKYVPSWEVLEKYGIRFGDILLQEQSGQSSDEESSCFLQ